MGLYENIRDIAKAKGYSINRLEQELGFARSSINKFNKNTPSTEKIQQIADLLNVSVDHILTGMDEPLGLSSYDRFEELCRLKGVTPYHVCKDTGITTATISNWEAGRYLPKQDKLQIIADYFGITIRYLMTGKDEAFDSDSEALVVAKQLFENPDLMEIFKTLTGEDIESIKTYRNVLRALNKES